MVKTYKFKYIFYQITRIINLKRKLFQIVSEYQEEEPPEEPPEIVKRKIPFKDVEAQRIRDDVTIQVRFNIR